eukprot:tig00000025_g7942.t1
MYEAERSTAAEDAPTEEDFEDVGAALPADLTFGLLHRRGCSASAEFVPVPAELGDHLEPRSPHQTRPVPRGCYHLICSRQYKLGLLDRGATAAWVGRRVRLWLAYRDNGEQVLHAFWPNGTPKPEQAKRMKWRLPAEGPGAGDVGPLLLFQRQAGSSSNFRNAVSCREVILTLDSYGISEERFGFVATSFCHGRRAFLLGIEALPPAPAPPVCGRIELTTRTHQRCPLPRLSLRHLPSDARASLRRSRPLGISVFGAAAAATTAAAARTAVQATPSPREAVSSDEEEEQPARKRRGPPRPSTPARAPLGGRPAGPAAPPGPRPPGPTGPPRYSVYMPAGERPGTMSPLVGLLDQLHLSDSAYLEVAEQWEASVRHALRAARAPPAAQFAFDEFIPSDDEGAAEAPPAPQQPPAPFVLLCPPAPPLPPFPDSARGAVNPERLLWFLQLSPADCDAVLVTFAEALEGRGPLSGDRAGKALLDPRLLGSPLVSTFPGRYRLTQALHRLIEAGHAPLVESFVGASVALLVNIPAIPRREHVEAAVRAMLRFVEAGTGPAAMLTPQLLILSDTDARMVLEAARRLLVGSEDDLRELHCELLFRRAVVEWQMDREGAALEAFFECWSAIVRLGLAPSRLEARLLSHLLNLSIRVPGNLALARHLTKSVYWFEETPEDIVDMAFTLVYLGLVETFRNNLPQALAFLDRSLAALQRLVPYGDCYRQLTIRPLITRSVTNTLMNRLASATKDYRSALLTMKELCRTPSVFWDVMYMGRHQYVHARRAHEAGAGAVTARDLNKQMRLNLLAIKVSDLADETPLRAHALARTGEYYLATGRFARAAPCLEEAARMLGALFPRCFPASHPYQRHLRALRDTALAHQPAPVPRPLPGPSAPAPRPALGPGHPDANGPALRATH